LEKYKDNFRLFRNFMKTNWQTKKLGKVCDVLDNKRKPITKRNRTTGEYPYYGATGILDYVGDYIFDEKLVLIGEDGAKWESGEHTAFIAEGKYWVNNHAHVIRPHRDIILDNWIIYLFYFNDLTKHTTGLTVPKLNQANLRNIKIPLPPLSEQHRIVKILDGVFADVAKAKESAEKNFQNAKELFESYLNNIFANPGKNWEEEKLGKVCGFVRGPFGGSLKKSIFKKEGYVVYEQQHAIYNQFTKVRYFVDEKKFNEMKRFELNPGDLIMSCSGTMGKIAIAPDNIKKGIINQALLKLSPSKNLLNIFLKYWMESSVFQDDLNKYTKGAAIKNVVSVKILKEIKLFVPKIQQQKSIVAKLDAVSAETKKLEVIYQQKLADLEELKKSVLKKAFCGGL